MKKGFIRVRRLRPTVQDAEAFLVGRPHAVWKTDYVTASERVTRIDALRSRLKLLIKEHLPARLQLDFVILKGHLLVEFTLTEYIGLRSHYEYDVSTERLSFVQKMAVAHMLGFPLDPLIMPSLELLNRLRNQVAHGLDFDRGQVDKLLRFFAEDPDERPTHTDQSRVREMRRAVEHLVWAMLGVIEGQHVAAYEAVEHGA
jgi:hypothetical protein